jgi:hypothetical protein
MLGKHRPILSAATEVDEILTIVIPGVNQFDILLYIWFANLSFHKHPVPIEHIQSY